MSAEYSQLMDQITAFQRSSQHLPSYTALSRPLLHTAPSASTSAGQPSSSSSSVSFNPSSQNHPRGSPVRPEIAPSAESFISSTLPKLDTLPLPDINPFAPSYSKPSPSSQNPTDTPHNNDSDEGSGEGEVGEGEMETASTAAQQSVPTVVGQTVSPRTNIPSVGGGYPQSTFLTALPLSQAYLLRNSTHPESVSLQTEDNKNKTTTVATVETNPTSAHLHPPQTDNSQERPTSASSVSSKGSKGRRHPNRTQPQSRRARLHNKYASAPTTEV